MSYLTNFTSTLAPLLETIVANPRLHGKWLNTLSFLENSGARKIAACEHPLLVKEEMLKHAAEEFRHAHYLKRQLSRLHAPLFDYSPASLLGGWQTIHYLNRLDVSVNRELRKHFPRKEAKLHAYTLVTYAIELRAHELYHLYQKILRQFASPVMVTSILIEEKGHLQEMKEGLKQMPNGELLAQKAVELEAGLCWRWLATINNQII